MKIKQYKNERINPFGTDRGSVRRRVLVLMLTCALGLTAALAASCTDVKTPDEQGADVTAADNGSTGGDAGGAKGDDPSGGSSSTESSGSGAASEGPALSEEEAIKIVLDRVPGAEKSEIISFSRDYEDGRWEYDGKLVHDGIEYEFEIDAQNGNLLEWELDD